MVESERAVHTTPQNGIDMVNSIFALAVRNCVGWLAKGETLYKLDKSGKGGGRGKRRRWKKRHPNIESF